MSDAQVSCPQCGHRFAVSDALSSQLQGEIETRLRAEHEARLAQAVEQARTRALESAQLELADLRCQLTEKAKGAEAAQAEQLELRRKARTLEEEIGRIEEKVRTEVEQTARAEADKRIKAAAAQAAAGAREQSSLELKSLQEQLAEQQAKAREAQEAELALRKEKGQLEERARHLDLEVARKLDAEKQRLEEGIRRTVSEEQALKVREKDKQIEDLKRLLDEAKRKSEQGSQERQGEVLELDIQAALERQFPRDQVKAVPKGAAGADLLQEVYNAAGQSCGSIVWETKNTKHWQNAWVAKLKDDQRAVGANLAVLVSVALPDGIQEFGQVDGVWLAGLRAWPALAAVLRDQLVQVAFAHAASQGKSEKMEMLYRYLAGQAFRQKVQGIVEGFTALQDQLNRERRAMEKQWKERERQIERVITNTVGMYGEMSGILGGTLPDIPALTLEGIGLPEVVEE